MGIDAIYSFLIYPKRNEPDFPIGPGVEISIQNNKLNDMLGTIFNNARQDCVVPIMFVSDGPQQANPVRAELLALTDQPSISTASPIAARLQKATGGQSGLGLLFISLGQDNGYTRIVISRFPADEGVVAESSTTALSVQFVEQVFLKSAYSYKAATYLATGQADQLWSGHVVDRQLNAGNKAVANYWISDFLQSDFTTTPAAGTKRLASALRDAIATSTNLGIKHEITSAAHLAGNLPDQALTIAEFCEKFHFSNETKETVLAKVRPARLANERFRFDAEEFAKHIAYKQIELDSGAVLTAPADRFDNIFQETHNDKGHTYVTTGQIVDERLKRNK